MRPRAERKCSMSTVASIVTHPASGGVETRSAELDELNLLDYGAVSFVWLTYVWRKSDDVRQMRTTHVDELVTQLGGVRLVSVLLDSSDSEVYQVVVDLSDSPKEELDLQRFDIGEGVLEMTVYQRTAHPVGGEGALTVFRNYLVQAVNTDSSKRVRSSTPNVGAEFEEWCGVTEIASEVVEILKINLLGRITFLPEKE
jgi:hypothetical protein